MELELQMQLNNEQLLTAQNHFSDFGLVVYIDYEQAKYYIDVFAASALGLLSYQEAGNIYDSGNKLFEITEQTLENLKAIFKDRIIYVDLNKKDYSVHTDSDNNLMPEEYEPDNKKEDVFRSYLGDDINSLYQEFKSSNFDTDFDAYLEKLKSNEFNNPSVK